MKYTENAEDYLRAPHVGNSDSYYARIKSNQKKTRKDGESCHGIDEFFTSITVQQLRERVRRMRSQYNSKFLPKFLELHPNKVGLIMFDNSQNHNAKAPDGLDASKFNRFDVSDKLPKTNMRDGWFVDTITGEKKQQSMHLENGNYKGLETILRERGIVIQNLYESCTVCVDNRRASKVCCLKCRLENEPDFAAQLGWLQEVVETSKQLFLLYPKFHCELNPIELFWGYIKSLARTMCEYNLKKL